MVNKFLGRIETLGDNFICVTPTIGERTAPTRDSIQGIKDAIAHVRGGGALGLFPAGAISDMSLKDGCKPLVTMLSKANVAFPLSGNKVEIMTDFTTMSDRLVTDIESARQHINILFFKFEDDPAYTPRATVEFEGNGRTVGVAAGMVITEELAEMKLYFEKNDYLCGL